MTTASIPELRKAHTRTRAQLARAAVRYGKRALAGPPSDQEVALLRELLAAAEAMTAAAREHRAAANWQPQQQPWAGVAGANPDPLAGLWWAAFRLDTAQAAGDPAATIEAGKALQAAAIAFCEVDRTGWVRAGKAADDAGNPALDSG